MKLYTNDKQFYKLVAGIAVPIALQGLITTGVNMMDTIMIGAVGETELSAVSLANQFISIFQIFCMGIGMGASVLVARYFGMKDNLSLKKTVCLYLKSKPTDSCVIWFVPSLELYWKWEEENLRFSSFAM